MTPAAPEPAAAPFDRSGSLNFKARLPALDGIRALAVTLVFARHYGGGSHGGPVLQAINLMRTRGWVGVDLFFVLSGFLITGILYDTSQDSHFFRRFFARRALRILPAFYLLFVLLVITTPLMHWQWHLAHLSFPLYLGNLFGNADFSINQLRSSNHPLALVTLGHLWSLCVEEQFYLIWPVLVFAIPNRIRLIQTAAALSILAVALRIAFVLNVPAPMAELWIIRTLPFRLDTLLTGAILALLLRGPHARAILRACKCLFPAASAGVVWIFLFRPAYDDPALLTAGLSLIALASAGLIGMALVPGTVAFRLFHLNPLQMLGRYSYGFYIYHLLFRTAWIALLVVLAARWHSLALAGVLTLGANYVVTFLVAKLSYDLFEVRFLRLKQRLLYDSEQETQHHGFRTQP